MPKQTPSASTWPCHPSALRSASPPQSGRASRHRGKLSLSQTTEVDSLQRPYHPTRRRKEQLLQFHSVDTLAVHHLPGRQVSNKLQGNYQYCYQPPVGAIMGAQRMATTRQVVCLVAKVVAKRVVGRQAPVLLECALRLQRRRGWGPLDQGTGSGKKRNVSR